MMTGSIKCNWYVYLFLIVVTIVVYSRVGGLEFVHYDDDIYVTGNEHVKAGLTVDGIRWSFSATPNGDWIPLTWVSFMADHELSKRSPLVLFENREDPAYYHRTNLILHVANTLLLFIILSSMTGLRWRSAMVAALFAVHPLHVESVAWVTERKDVLSTLFMMLAIWAYIWYVGKPRTRCYLLVVLLFALGLMSKSMVVTLPLVLLLLDFWPLRRIDGWTADKTIRGKTFGQAVVEKLPLLAVCAVASIVTVIAQERGNALRSLAEYPIGVRVANALVTYVAYLWKTIWPTNLACMYPHPGSGLPVWEVIGSGLLLVGITLATARAVRKRPYLALGWLWYVATLFPAIGIVQFGIHGMADRFTYVTLTGVFIAVVWGVCDLVPQCRSRAPLLAILAMAMVVPLSVRAHSQINYWHDSRALFTHAIDVTANNAQAYHYFANALMSDGEICESIPYFRRAISIKPTEVPIHNNLGTAYAAVGNIAGARQEFCTALRLDKHCTEALCNLAAMALNSGNMDEARRYALEANRIAPNNRRVRQAMQAVGVVACGVADGKQALCPPGNP